MIFFANLLPVKFKNIRKNLSILHLKEYENVLDAQFLKTLLQTSNTYYFLNNSQVIHYFRSFIAIIIYLMSFPCQPAQYQRI